MARNGGRVMLALAFLTALTLHLLLFSYSPMIPVLTQEMRISYAEAGLVFSICILTIILLRVPWGLLSDRLGSSATMKWAMVFIGIFSVLRGFAPSYYTLLACQMLLGVGFAALLPCLGKIVNTMFRDKAGVATGIYVSGFPIGELLGLGLASHLLLVMHTGWRMIFQLFGVWSLILAALWWLVDIGSSEQREARSGNQPRIAFRDLLGMKQVWMLTGLCICSMGCYDTLLTFLPVVLQLKGISATEASASALMFPVGFLIAGPVVGAVSDKVGLRKPFIYILGFSSALLILLIPYLAQLGLWATILLVGFSLSGILTLVLAISSEHPELSRSVGGAIGVISSLGNMGSFQFPILVGFLIDATKSLDPPLSLLAVISGATVVLNLAILETGRLKVDRWRPAAGH